MKRAVLKTMIFGYLLYFWFFFATRKNQENYQNFTDIFIKNRNIRNFFILFVKKLFSTKKLMGIYGDRDAKK